MNRFILTREDRLINTISVAVAFLVLLVTLYPFYWCFNDSHFQPRQGQSWF